MSCSDLLTTHVAIGLGQEPNWAIADRFLEVFPEGLTDDQKEVLADTHTDFDDTNPECVEEFVDSLIEQLHTFKKLWRGQIDLRDTARITIGGLDVLIAGGAEGEVGQTSESWDLVRDLSLAGVLAAAGFITSETEGRQTVTCLSWENKHGTDISAHANEDLARGYLADICRREWDLEVNGPTGNRTPPESDDEVIEEYFEAVPYEFYTVTTVPLETTRRQQLVAS